MPSDDTLHNVFPIVGTVIGICVNLSPGILFTEIVKNKRVFTEIPEAMLLSNLLCNCINLALGLNRTDYIMIVSSSMGTFLALVWAIWYLYYYYQYEMKQFFLHAFIALNLSIEFVWIFGFILNELADITGGFAIAITIINFATPGQNILKVIKTKKHKLIPIWTTLTCLVCSICWLIYGIIEVEYKLYVPNGLGFLFGLLQLTVWAMHYCKREKYPKAETKPLLMNNDDESRAESNHTLTNDYTY